MAESLNETLAKHNNELLRQIIRLEKLLKEAREYTGKTPCLLCLPDAKCGYHEQIEKLSKNKLKAKVDELETSVESLSTNLEKETTRADSASREAFEIRGAYTLLRAELDSLVLAAKQGVVEEFKDIQARDREHVEFIHKVAKRLGIHPDTTIDRIKLMVDDALRKLLA